MGNHLATPLQSLLHGLAGLIGLTYTSCQQVSSALETLQLP
jgi:hypothetical protein